MENPTPAANGCLPNFTLEDLEDDWDSGQNDPIWLVVVQVFCFCAHPFPQLALLLIYIMVYPFARCERVKDLDHDEPP